MIVALPLESIRSSGHVFLP